MNKLDLHISYPRGIFNTKDSQSFAAITEALNRISKKVDEIVDEVNELKTSQTASKKDEHPFGLPAYSGGGYANTSSSPEPGE